MCIFQSFLRILVHVCSVLPKLGGRRVRGDRVQTVELISARVFHNFHPRDSNRGLCEACSIQLKLSHVHNLIRIPKSELYQRRVQYHHPNNATVALILGPRPVPIALRSSLFSAKSVKWFRMVELDRTTAKWCVLSLSLGCASLTDVRVVESGIYSSHVTQTAFPFATGLVN